MEHLIIMIVPIAILFLALKMAAGFFLPVGALLILIPKLIGVILRGIWSLLCWPPTRPRKHRPYRS